MKCIVLGGGGFLGSNLAEALVAAGHKVKIFDKPGFNATKKIESSESIEVLEGNFLNVVELSQAIEGCDVVYHLISTTLPKSSNDAPVYDIESNVVGTLNLLQAMVEKKVKKIVFLSSGGTIYGIPQQIPLNELHPTNPICSYGIGKLAIEKYLQLYHLLHGIDYAILRLSNPFGKGQSLAGIQGVITAFLHKVLTNQPIEIWGDGTVIRDYIYVSDVTNALLKAMDNCSADRLFNIGSGEGISINEIITHIETLIKRPVNYQFLPRRDFDVPVNILDISKAKEMLHWCPQVSFEEGLAKTWEWLNQRKINEENLI